MKSTRNYLIVFFVVTTIAGLALAYREYLTLIKLRTELNDPTAGISKQLADAQKLIKELRAQLDAARGGDDLADDQGGPGGDQGGGDRGNRRSFRDQMRSLFNSPQMQALRSVEDKMRLNGTYGALFKNLAANLNLSPEQLDQFKNLLVQKQQAMQDAYAAARAQGLNPRTDPEGFKAAIAAAQNDINTQIQQTLGDAGYQQYQQYTQQMPERNTVNQLQQALSYTSSPLTDDQQQAMINLLQQNQKASTTGATGGTGGGGRGGFGGPGGGGGTATINTATVTQAASILSTTQLQALQQVQQAQQAQQQMESLMRAQGSTKGGGTKSGKGG